MQIVFQDPFASLNPRMSIRQIIEEGLIVNHMGNGKERLDRVRELLRQVGLSPTYTERYPYEFSGGQRQRIAIARAIALDPKLIVLDEAVSALDVSTQNQILELLERLRDEFDVAYLFISHNLSVIRWLADRTAVMYLGRIVEEGPAAEVYSRPKHPYTEALLSAIPVPNPVRQRTRERIVLTGDIPSPAAPPDGCRFHTRCPHALPLCRTVDPSAYATPDGTTVSCHLHTEGPRLAGDTVLTLRAARAPD